MRETTQTFYGGRNTDKKYYYASYYYASKNNLHMIRINHHIIELYLYYASNYYASYKKKKNLMHQIFKRQFTLTENRAHPGNHLIDTQYARIIPRIICLTDAKPK